MTVRESDIGTHFLRLNARDQSGSGNFVVKVTFSKQVAATTEIKKYGDSQRDIVLSVIESDHLLKNTHICNSTAQGILSCLTTKDFKY